MKGLYQMRLCIETSSPLAIQTGQVQDLGDNQLVMDANHLPMIPATSMAGVWRSLVSSELSLETAELWFGSTHARALLNITNGYVHNSQNQPCTGLMAQADIDKDALLQELQGCDESKSGIVRRDRTALNDRGVVARTAKFEQLLLPAGLRFSFKIRAVLDGDQAEQLNRVFTQLLNPAFALGSSVSNGLGKFSVVESLSGMQTIALHNETRQQAKAVISFNRAWQVPTEPLPLEGATPDCLVKLPLVCEGTWAIGTGRETLLQHDVKKLDNVSSVYRENRYDFSAQQFRSSVLAPGSSIKGLIAHRVQFHLNALEGVFAEQSDVEFPIYSTTPKNTCEQYQSNIEAFFNRRSAVFEALFGKVNKHNEQSAKAGMLHVEDALVAYRDEDIQLRTHNKIDRFSGGVIDQMLFFEEVLSNVKFTVVINLTPRGKALLAQEPMLCTALARTIRDLQTGRLAVGAKTGRGHSQTKVDKTKDTFINALIGDTRFDAQGDAA